MEVGAETWSGYRAWLLATDHALSTAEKSERYLRFLATEHGLELDPASFSRERVIVLLARGRELGVKPRTLNSWIREIHLWARFHKLEWRVPYFRRRGLPIIPVPDQRMERRLRALTWTDMSVSARNRAILQLLLDVGPRRQEVVRLNLEDRQVTAGGDPIVIIRAGKGEKDRVLWISPDTFTLLESYVSTHRSPTDPRALFTTRTGRLSYNYLGNLIKESGRRVGVTWLSAHKLRHRCVDSLFDAGVSVASVAQLMGHARLETTAIYRSQQLAKRRAEEEIRAVSEARFGRKTK